MKNLLFFFLAGAVPVLSWYLAVYTDIIREPGPPSNPEEAVKRRFSLDKTQLLWWTTILIFCYIWHYAETSKVAALDRSHMWLLGISAGTAVAGLMIDNEVKRVGLAPENESSKGFFRDLLTENPDHYSILNYQHFLFNFVFGLIFITYFFGKCHILYPFGTEELVLMGVSSTAFEAMRYGKLTK